MIITRTPLRISFVGGGSDLPAFYAEEDGLVVSAAIDKYITVIVSKKFDPAIRVAYSQTENVATVDDLEHPLVRAALKRYGPASHVEIHTIGDIPAGTGLGSSSSFAVGLLAALAAYHGGYVPPLQTAMRAIELERGDCGQPVGDQDQLIAALGGLQAITFRAGGQHHATPIANSEIVDLLERHVLLLATGLPARDARAILGRQSVMDGHTRRATAELVRLARTFREALLWSDLQVCGETMHDAWEIKRSIAAGVTNDQIDRWYTQALSAGAWGGKLCGAGGGGFLLFLAPPDAHARIIAETGLRRVSVRLGVPGVSVMHV